MNNFKLFLILCLIPLLTSDALCQFETEINHDGIVFPKMTTAQRDSLSNNGFAVDGQCIYNIYTKSVECYYVDNSTGGAWTNISNISIGHIGNHEAFSNRQPYLGVNFIIALQGTFPSPSIHDDEEKQVKALSSEPFLGQIIMFGGNFAPRGWAFCDGQILPISQYSALFSILGWTYGGDEQTTFALPDLRGSVPVHEGNGPGINNVTLGEKNGNETTTLTNSNLPAHTHSVIHN